MATKKRGNKSDKPTGRPKPESGVAHFGKRYGCGGKIKRK